jgi:hypothetical protein
MRTKISHSIIPLTKAALGKSVELFKKNSKDYYAEGKNPLNTRY